MNAIHLKLPPLAGREAFAALVEDFPERIPATEATFATLPRDARRFYMLRLREHQEAPLTELAARCLASRARRDHFERLSLAEQLGRRKSNAGRMRFEYRFAHVETTSATSMVWATVDSVKSVPTEVRA